jgi:CheY-like chemotaxis protein
MPKRLGSNIEIKTKLAADLTLVHADPTQLDQVLMNRCINARDAMPNGGHLIIETGDAVFDEKYCAVQTFARPGHNTMMAVTDTGTGMDAATLERIFEPFFTTKETGKGTGLGLATVYGIVRQHGRFLHVYSEVGIGATFRVYLPATAVGEKTTANAQDSRPARGGSETILIAEDHEGLRELARETLANLGYEILIACDGKEAVSMFLANRDRMDLLLLDVVLPKLNVPEAYARISAEKKDVPVIFATGCSPEMALLQDAQERGLTILQKPYVPKELGRRRVRETLDRQPAKTHHE